ncbi:signal transduction histidine kinase [Burkholderiales bacterium JOSHI_001]|nr:signal transduction histidine kinase [Burkholderiales bacterium JOSHI_001]
MKLARWACSSLAALGLAALAGAATGQAAQPLQPARAEVIVSSQAEPPAADDPRWREVPLADAQVAPAAWYRIHFDMDAAAAQRDFWMIYLPYFYGGGRLWLNGALVAEVTQNSPRLRVRWERPSLLPLPAAALRPGANLLLVRAEAAWHHRDTMMPPLALGPQTVLQARFDQRLFIARSVPVVAVASGAVVGLLVLLVWWRRRNEVLYGLFGLAALLWALRTTTFVFDTLSPPVWDAWRLMYFLSTGGFIVVLALFTLALAGWQRRWITRGLLGYWALGPLAYLVGGEAFTARVWVAGLLPVGLAIAITASTAAWRQRSAATISIAVALLVAFVAGLHDYLVAWRSPLVQALAPGWAGERHFLLHHAAMLLLVVMGALLALRLVRTLGEVEAANRTLESRVQQREREVVASYERIAALQRSQAATDERQRIMRDLHDGLGSQLFTSLSRAERGALDADSMADTLRGAIDEMRLAIEALASDEGDFRTAFGNFHFRWDARLREAGLTPHWQLDLPDEVLAIAPHDALQILRIAQEAMTNILKHARAQTVRVRLGHEDGTLALDIADDGRGSASEGHADSRGRGRSNMRLRAQRLGATLELQATPGGNCVSLRMPMLVSPRPPGD